MKKNNTEEKMKNITKKKKMEENKTPTIKNKMNE